MKRNILLVIYAFPVMVALVLFFWPLFWYSVGYWRY